MAVTLQAQRAQVSQQTRFAPPERHHVVDREPAALGSVSGSGSPVAKSLSTSFPRLAAPAASVRATIWAS